MYTLYWNTDTGAFAPNLVLALARAPFERVRIDHRKGENRTPAYLKISPLGQIPALRLPDDSTITESAAMLLHLVEAYPGAGLAPPPGTGARAHFHRWLLFLATGVYGAVLRVSYPERHTDDPAGAAAVREAANRALETQWAIVEAAIEPGPYLFGPSITAADIYLAMLACWYDGLASKPRVRRIHTLVRSTPEGERLWQEYFPS